jgi:hypothetical protein
MALLQLATFPAHRPKEEQEEVMTLFERLARCLVVFGLTIAPLACGSASRPPSPPPTPPGSAPAAEEWVSGPVELRKLTAVVLASPPQELREQLERAAASSTDPEVAARLRERADAESLGSGFVLVRREGGRAEDFVVTNQYVVADAGEVRVMFDGGAVYGPCEVLYADPKLDVAVVGFPDGEMPFAYGLRPTPQVLAELEGMTAQVVPDRHAMSLSVPATVVEDAVRRAFRARVGQSDARWLTRELEGSCKELQAELGGKGDRDAMEGFVSEALDASSGLDAVSAVLTGDERMAVTLRSLLWNDPYAARRFAVAWVLTVGGVASEVRAGGRCEIEAPVLEPGKRPRARTHVQTARGSVAADWVFDRGDWRLAATELFEVGGYVLTLDPKKPHAASKHVAKR